MGRREQARIYENAIEESISRLRDHHFDMQRPLRQRFIMAPSPLGAAARYISKTDTMQLFRANELRRPEITGSLEHELIHKWQYDGGTSIPRSFKKRANRVASFISSELPALMNRYDFIRYDCDPTSGLLKEENRKTAAAFILSGDEILSVLSDYDERIAEAERQGQRYHDKLLDAEDPDSRDDLHQQLRRHWDAEKHLKSQQESEYRQLLSNLQEDISTFLAPIHKRFARVSRIEPLVKSAGEGMTWFWTVYRWTALDQPIKSNPISNIHTVDQIDIDNEARTRAIMQTLFNELGYPTSNYEFFEGIYDHYLDYASDFDQKEAVTKAMKEARNMFEEERRRIM